MRTNHERISQKDIALQGPHIGQHHKRHGNIADLRYQNICWLCFEFLKVNKGRISEDASRQKAIWINWWNRYFRDEGGREPYEVINPPVFLDGHNELVPGNDIRVNEGSASFLWDSNSCRYNCIISIPPRVCRVDYNKVQLLLAVIKTFIPPAWQLRRYLCINRG